MLKEKEIGFKEKEIGLREKELSLIKNEQFTKADEIKSKEQNLDFELYF